MLLINEGGVAAPRVVEGSQGFRVKCENWSELLWKVPKKGHFKTENWKNGSPILFNCLCLDICEKKIKNIIPKCA